MRISPKSFLCPKASPSGAEFSRPVPPGTGPHSQARGVGEQRHPRGKGEKIVSNIPSSDKFTFSSRPSARPSRPAVHRRLHSPASSRGPLPRKPQAQRGAGPAGAARPAGGEGRTSPVASPDGIFLPSSSLSRSDLNFPKPGRASPEPRARGRRVGAVTLEQPPNRGRGFSRSCAVFCRCRRHRINFLFICFTPALREKRTRGGAGSPREAQDSGSAGCGHRRLCELGRRCGLRARTSFLPVCPANLSAEEKSRTVYGFRCGSGIKPRSRSVAFDIFS